MKRDYYLFQNKRQNRKDIPITQNPFEFAGAAMIGQAAGPTDMDDEF
jgi:hypothetical protein